MGQRLDFKIELCVWEEPSAEEEKLINAIIAKLQKDSSDIKIVRFSALKSSTPLDDSDIYIAFGDVAYSALLDLEDKDIYKAPLLSLMLGDNGYSYKVEANEVFKEVIETINKANSKTETEVYVEHQGVTFGPGGDINITEEEAEYLKKIKDIIGGGTVTITKGNIKLKIEDKNERNS